MHVVLLVLTLAFGTCQAAQFLQLTDFHFDKDYSANSGVIADKCHSQNRQTRIKLGPFGEYACDAPKSLIRRTLSAASEVIPNPDFIFWTGDNIPHIDDYDEAYVISSMQSLSSMVDGKFPNASVLPVFGNHDFAPSNAFPDKNCTLYVKIFSMWKHWIGLNNEGTFLKGGYYKFALPNNVVVLALNTNLYYKFNGAIPSFTNKIDPADQFQFMIDTLEEAKQQNRTVHVIAHIPPGVFERTPNFTWMVPEYNQRLIDITIQYADTIKWMIFGHHHTDTFHIVKDPKTKFPVQVYLMAPAVTPWLSTLPGAGANNPSFRVFDYEPTTQKLIDAKTYYVNLDELNKNASTQWQLEYSMKDAYSLNEINAISMNGLLEKMKTDETLFMKYIEYNSVSYDVKKPVAQWRGAQLCSIEHPDFEGYEACLSKYPIVSTPAATTTPVQTTTTSAGPQSDLCRSLMLCIVALIIRL